MGAFVLFVFAIPELDVCISTLHALNIEIGVFSDGQTEIDFLSQWLTLILPYLIIIFTAAPLCFSVCVFWDISMHFYAYVLCL